MLVGGIVLCGGQSRRMGQMMDEFGNIIGRQQQLLDDTFGQQVHANHSYRIDDVVWGGRFVDVNPVSLVTTAVRGLMDGSATFADVGLALAVPAVLTALLAPVTLWLYRRRD